ncbi:outer membrane lipoprotein carrier protein LolA [Flavobacteriales bacterium]|nr:outer membrane lipoprotein carrier protein LolA [Flavobacteriales bacterium]
MNKIIAVIFFLPLLVFSQDDKAESILDQLTKKTASYTSIEAHFTNTFVSLEAGVNEKQEGVLYLKDNAYRLELEAQTIMSDGETNWIFLKDEQEVNITDSDEEEDFNPSKIFTIYENDYKFKFIKEEAQKYYIELYPKTEGMFSKLEMVINKTKMEVHSLTMFDKNNSQYSYLISKFIPNQDFDNSFFQFNTSENPDVDVIDLR